MTVQKVMSISEGRNNEGLDQDNGHGAGETQGLDTGQGDWTGLGP